MGDPQPARADQKPSSSWVHNFVIGVLALTNLYWIFERGPTSADNAHAISQTGIEAVAAASIPSQTLMAQQVQQSEKEPPSPATPAEQAPPPPPAEPEAPAPADGGKSPEFLARAPPEPVPEPADPRLAGLVQFDRSAFSGMEPVVVTEAEAAEVPNRHVYQMTNESNYWSRIGFCRRGFSLVPEVQDSACIFRECIGHNGNYYDVSRLMLGAESAHKPGKEEGCYEASGGQLNNNKQVLVSFIYTAHNHPLMVAKSLLATFRVAHEVDSAEFVVLDDGSTEDMSPVVQVLDTLQELFGTRIIRKRSATALGFTIANNVALQLATGVYACTINSDLFPLPGAMAMLYYTLRSYPAAGMVGPMQLDKRGRVMEAGGTAFQQGHPYNMGRGRWPWELPYLHAHVVDYISAACIMFDRLEFLGLGLFDPRYAPAYFEDTDAALTMRRSGKLVILAPLATVVHLEGQSYVNSAKEQLMLENYNKFLAKHGDSLDRHCPSPRGEYQTCGSMDDIVAATMFNTIRRQGTQVLIVDFVVPEIDRESGSVRMKEMLQILLNMGYGVALQPDSVNSFVKYVLPMLAMGVHVMAPGALKAMAAQALTGPGSELAICPWQVAILSRRAVFHSQVAALQKVCPKIPLIYDTVDLHFVRERRSVDLALNTGDTAPVFVGDGFVDVHKTPKEEVEKLLKDGEALEVGFMNMSKYVLVVGSGEISIAGKRVGEGKVRLLTNIYPDPDRNAPFTPWSKRFGGLFVGSMCHTPNIDASKFIMREILKDHTMFPQGYIHLVWSGTDRCAALVGPLMEEARSHPLITLHLDVTNEELHELHMNALFFLGALRVGAGVKGKLCMALLYGLPIVGSDISSEGMFLESEKNILSATSPEEYASQIRRLQANEALWTSLRSEGFSVIERHFSRTAARTVLEEMFGSLGVQPRVKLGAGGQLRAEWVWECPLPEDGGGKKGLFPGRRDADCWSTASHNPLFTPLPALKFEDNFLADHVPRPKRIRGMPNACPVTGAPSVERPFVFHHIINAGAGALKAAVMESARQGNYVAGSNCEGKTDCRCNAMYQTPLAQLATCTESEDFIKGQVFLGFFAPLPLERLHPVQSNDKTCFIFLRDPVRRAMSHYYKYDVFQGYGSKHQDELAFADLEESFRRTGGGELMTRYLGCEDDEQCAQPIDKIMDSAKQELRKCHIGIAEFFKSSISYLQMLAPWLDLQTIPAPNRPAVFVESKVTLAKFSPETQEAVGKWFQPDKTLFAYGKALFEKQMHTGLRCAGGKAPDEEHASELAAEFRDLAHDVRATKGQTEQWQAAACLERVVSCREGPFRDKCSCSQQELAESTV